jgi:hypothetical protein
MAAAVSKPSRCRQMPTEVSACCWHLRGPDDSARAWMQQQWPTTVLPTPQVTDQPDPVPVLLLLLLLNRPLVSRCMRHAGCMGSSCLRHGTLCCLLHTGCLLPAAARQPAAAGARWASTALPARLLLMLLVAVVVVCCTCPPAAPPAPAACACCCKPCCACACCCCCCRCHPLQVGSPPCTQTQTSPHPATHHSRPRTGVPAGLLGHWHTAGPACTQGGS